MFDILSHKKSYPIYSASEIRAWEQRWFGHGNSSFGLMSQAGLLLAETVQNLILSLDYNYHCLFVVWCGVGNNGGDGYLLASFLKQKNFNVIIYAPFEPISPDCQKAKQIAMDNEVLILDKLDFNHINDQAINGDMIHIDALFGNGLNKNLSDDYQYIIHNFNEQNGLKIAIDIPSGLHPDTGIPMPVAVWVDYTLCLVGLKIGILTGQGKSHAGQVISLPLIPTDNELKTLATIDTYAPKLPKRHNHAHKGDFGHLAIIGGHPNMGGAVIIAAESAFACGVGKVTIICDKTHHSAILARNPNIMVKDIDDIYHDDFYEFLTHIDSIAVGMGLGRDEWGETVYLRLIKLLSGDLSNLILDADALYFLAKYPQNIDSLAHQVIATPHSAESARLLGCTPRDIDQDKVTTIYQLHTKYGGNWVLKGAGSLVLAYDESQHKNELSVCAFGNPYMATAGMGDALSGMIGGLMALNVNISLSECVSLHALAGDELAKHGEHGMQASNLPQAIRIVFNS